MGVASGWVGFGLGGLVPGRILGFGESGLA